MRVYVCLGEASRPKQSPQTLTTAHQLHRRLLPKTDMQQKVNTSSNQNFRTKLAKNVDLDDASGDENDLNRLPEINNSFDDLHFNNDWKQGEYFLFN